MTTTQPNPQTQRKPNWQLLVAVIVVASLLSGIVTFIVLSNVLDNSQPVTSYTDTQFSVQNSQTQGVTHINPRPVADFTFPAHTGDNLTLSDLQGRPVLLYFGYTHCPDVCPLTIYDYSRVREELGAQADDAAYLFISVDPERDTPESIAEYVGARGAGWLLGVSGDHPNLRRIGVDYGLYYEQQTETSSRAGYLVDHTASSYLLNAEGELVSIFAFGTEPAVIADVLRDYL